MSVEVLQQLANHLWQSTLFAAVAGLMTLLLRRNRARVRHGVWLAASCKFLIPLFTLIAVGNHFALRKAAPAAQSGVFIVANEVSTPFAGPATQTPKIANAPSLGNWVPPVLLGVWACGFTWIGFAWCMRWRRIRAIVRAGSPVDMQLPIPVISSSALLEPGIFGVLRPTLLLPAGIAGHLSPAQLESVIAHELCHFRYRDNLAAAFQMFVETVFWFHPLVWWIGKRIVAERERACDEEVLRLGSEPRTYAESILRVCALYVEAPLRCVSGVTGADLKKRVQAILVGPVVADLSAGRKAMLAVFGILCLALPVLVGIINPPKLQGQAGISVPLLPPAESFRSASIERCKTYMAGGILSPAPGKFIANCVATARLIDMAYTNSVVGISGGASNTPDIPLSGEPIWVDSNNYLYRIDARADPGTSLITMEGTMLQRLLADRFGLKIRRVTRESPMYSLIVAKNGARLKPSNERSCTGAWLRDVRFPQPFSQNCMAFAGPEAQYEALEGEAITLEQFCRLLASALGRPVIDNTGIAGKFDFHLKFAGDDTPTALGQLYPPLPDVLEEQLGLKLYPITGPRDFLVIDRVEQPLPE
jgi:bla regulator protein BlaR1